eukprot:24412-Eustigmatos_ZCMA.PRE.1
MQHHLLMGYRSELHSPVMAPLYSVHHSLSITQREAAFGCRDPYSWMVFSHRRLNGTGEKRNFAKLRCV